MQQPPNSWSLIAFDWVRLELFLPTTPAAWLLSFAAAFFVLLLTRLLLGKSKLSRRVSRLNIQIRPLSNDTREQVVAGIALSSAREWWPNRYGAAFRVEESVVLRIGNHSTIALLETSGSSPKGTLTVSPQLAVLLGEITDSQLKNPPNSGLLGERDVEIGTRWWDLWSVSFGHADPSISLQWRLSGLFLVMGYFFPKLMDMLLT